MSDVTNTRPVQAALTSAATFAVGATLPLLMVVTSPACSPPSVMFWGALALILTAGIGKMLGKVVRMHL